LAGDRGGLARWHFLDRQADQLVGGVVAEHQRVAIAGHDLAELVVAGVAEAVTGARGGVGQGGQSTAGVIRLSLRRGRVAPGPAGRGGAPAQGVFGAALVAADVRAQGGVIDIDRSGAVVGGAGHRAAGRIQRPGQATDRAAEAELPAGTAGQLALAVIGPQHVQRQAVEDQALVLCLQHQVARRAIDDLRHVSLADRGLPAQPLPQLRQRRVTQTQTVTRDHCDHVTCP